MKFHCEHCEQRIDAPDELAGTDADCPACGEAITVPISGSKKQLPVLPEEAQRKLIQQEQLAVDMAKEAAEMAKEAVEMSAEKSKLETDNGISEEAKIAEMEIAEMEIAEMEQSIANIRDEAKLDMRTHTPDFLKAYHDKDRPFCLTCDRHSDFQITNTPKMAGTASVPVGDNGLRVGYVPVSVKKNIYCNYCGKEMIRFSQCDWEQLNKWGLSSKREIENWRGKPEKPEKPDLDKISGPERGVSSAITYLLCGVLPIVFWAWKASNPWLEKCKGWYMHYWVTAEGEFIALIGVFGFVCWAGIWLVAFLFAWYFLVHAVTCLRNIGAYDTEEKREAYVKGEIEEAKDKYARDVAEYKKLVNEELVKSSMTADNIIVGKASDGKKILFDRRNIRIFHQ